MISLRNIILKIFLTFAVITIPVTNVFLANLGKNVINFGDTLTSCIILSLIFFTLLYTLKIFTKLNGEKLLLITCCLFYFFFLFSVFEKIVKIAFSNFAINYEIINTIAALIWLISIILIYILINKLYNKNLNKLLSSLFILIFLINIFLITKFFNDKDYFYNTPDSIFIETKLKLVEFKKFPNVYLLIYDMYASKEYISKSHPELKYEINNFLEEKKFIVTENHLSNYPHTSLSVPSILNANYFNEEFYLGKKNSKLIFDHNIKNENSVDAIFKKNNYISHYIFCWGDYHLRKKYCVNKRDLSYIANLDITFINAVLYHTPLKNYLSQLQFFNKDIGRIYISEFSDIINKIGIKKSKPTFTYLHHYFPHPPYIFDKNCNFREIPADELVSNNLLITNDKNRFDGYAQNFICSTNVIKKTVNKILEIDENAYIIVISDHGPHLNGQKKNNNVQYIDILDMHSTIMSLKVDDSCKSSIKLDDLSHVNIFRILANCLSNEKNPLLTNYIFYEDVKYSAIPRKKIDMNELTQIKGNN